MWRFPVAALAGALLALTVPTLALGALRPEPGIELSNPGANDELPRARAAEPAWMKLQMEWESLEPTPRAYEVPNTSASRALDRMDEWLTDAKRDGARTQLIIYNAPAWASGIPNTASDAPTPQNVVAYADFLRMLTERLGSRVDAWVPWNEPNLEIFWANPDPTAYVRLQRAAYGAIKGVDPSATVSSAPIAGVDGRFGGVIGGYEFLAAAYGAGLRDAIDVLGWNTYPPTTPEARLLDDQGRPMPSTLGAQQEVDRILRRFDPTRAVWIGEFGWSTCAPCRPENRVGFKQQARYLPRAFLYLRRYAPRVEVAVWFKLLDGSPDRAIWTQNSGLIRWNGSTKPSYRAFVDLKDRIRISPSAMRLRLPARRQTGAGTVAITRPSMRYSWGVITARTRVSVPDGGTYFLQGYRDGRWTRISAGRLPPGRSNVRLRYDDSGQLALRLLVRHRGDASWTVGRVMRLKGTLAPAR